MAYDPSTERVMLFGGQSSLGVLSDVWAWDGTCWTEREFTAGPVGRFQHGMAWDDEARVVILFGGMTMMGFATGTWMLSDAGWTQVSTTEPQPRAQHLVVTRQGRAHVLTGRAPGMNPNSILQFDSGGWMTLPAQPGFQAPIVWGAAGAYLPSENVFIVQGGQTPGGPTSSVFSDPSGRWAVVPLSSAEGPPALYGHAMVYDELRQQLVLFGGTVNGARQNTTWLSSTGSDWVVPSAPGPSARAGHAMAWDAARGVVVLFGGDTGSNSNETWTWNGIEWRQVGP